MRSLIIVICLLIGTIIYSQPDNLMFSGYEEISDPAGPGQPGRTINSPHKIINQSYFDGITLLKPRVKFLEVSYNLEKVTLQINNFCYQDTVYCIDIKLDRPQKLATITYNRITPIKLTR